MQKKHEKKLGFAVHIPAVVAEASGHLHLQRASTMSALVNSYFQNAGARRLFQVTRAFFHSPLSRGEFNGSVALCPRTFNTFVSSPTKRNILMTTLAFEQISLPQKLKIPPQWGFFKSRMMQICMVPFKPAEVLLQIFVMKMYLKSSLSIYGCGHNGGYH